jgi:hypothetical protein
MTIFLGIERVKVNWKQSIRYVLLDSFSHFFCLFNSIFSQYVCHAEVNAILNKNSSDVRGCSVNILDYPITSFAHHFLFPLIDVCRFISLQRMCESDYPEWN